MALGNNQHVKRRPEEAVAFVENLRKLLAHHKVSDAARIAGVSQPAASNIKNGRRHAKKPAVTVEGLGLHKVSPAQPCRRCERSAYLFTLGWLCVECELLDLVRKGVIKVS